MKRAIRITSFPLGHSTLKAPRCSQWHLTSNMDTSVPFGHLTFTNATSYRHLTSYGPSVVKISGTMAAVGLPVGSHTISFAVVRAGNW